MITRDQVKALARKRDELKISINRMTMHGRSLNYDAQIDHDMELMVLEDEFQKAEWEYKKALRELSMGVEP